MAFADLAAMTTPTIALVLLLLAVVVSVHTAPSDSVVRAVQDQPPVPCGQQRVQDWKAKSVHALDQLEDIRYQLNRKLEILGELASEEDYADKDSQMKDATVAAVRDFFQYGGVIFQCPDVDVKVVVDQVVQEAYEHAEHLYDIVSEAVPHSAAAYVTHSDTQSASPSQQSEKKGDNVKDFSERKNRDDDSICIVRLMVTQGKTKEEATSLCSEQPDQTKRDDSICIVRLMVTQGKTKEEATSLCSEQPDQTKRDDSICIVRLMVTQGKTKEEATSLCSEQPDQTKRDDSICIVRLMVTQGKTKEEATSDCQVSDQRKRYQSENHIFM